MVRELYRLANRGLVGEPEDIVLQKVGGVDIIEFSQINKVIDNTGIRSWDDEVDEPKLFQKDGHRFYINFVGDDRIIEL
jgi:hypothetical protein